MSYDNELINGRLQEWFSHMEQFDLPKWEQLPQLELYMDQVIILLKQYLAPLHHGDEDKAVTASIINNYVRMKLVPAPVKKKYSRVHIASLIMICALKQSLSISCIQRMLPPDQNEEDMAKLYNDFVQQYRVVQNIFTEQAKNGESPLFYNRTDTLLTSCAIISNLSTGLSEYLLHEEDTEPTDKKSKKNSAE